MSGDRAEGAGTGESREGEKPSLDFIYAEESEEAGVREMTNIPHVNQLRVFLVHGPDGMRVTRPV